MLRIEDPAPKASSDSRMSLAIMIEPAQANGFGTLHGGVMLKLADECGAIAALRHAGKGQITTAAIDSMIFIGPVYVGERVEITAEVTFVGRTSIETRIEIFAEPIEISERRKVAVGYAALRRARRDRTAAQASPAAADQDRGRPPRGRGRAGTTADSASTPVRSTRPDRTGRDNRTLRCTGVRSIPMLVGLILHLRACGGGRRRGCAGSSNLGTTASV